MDLVFPPPSFPSPLPSSHSHNNLPKTINPQLLNPSLHNSSSSSFNHHDSRLEGRRPLSSFDLNTLSNTNTNTPFNPSFDRITQERIASNPLHPLNHPRKEYNSVWLSQDWAALPFSTTSSSSTPAPETHSQYIPSITRYPNITPADPSSLFATTSVFPFQYSLPSSTFLTAGQPSIPFSEVNNQLNYPLPVQPLSNTSNLPYSYPIQSPLRSLDNLSFDMSSSSPISPTGRSTTFPFRQIVPPEHTIPRYAISSERDTNMNMVNADMDMGCQGQSYPLAPAIDLPSSSSMNDNIMVWNIPSVQGEILSVADQDVGEGTEVDSDDEFDASLLRSRPQAQTFVPSRSVIEEEGTVVSPQETNGIISIELSSSSSSSLSFTATPTVPTNGVSASVESKTTVLSLEETSSPEVATPLPSSRPGVTHRRGPSFNSYVPKSTHSPSSSGDEYEKEEPEPEVVSRNGRYPARMNTLKNQEQKKRNKKVHGKSKAKSKAKGKARGKGKVGGGRLDKGKAEAIGQRIKRSSSDSSYKISGGLGRSMAGGAVGAGGSKVPTGAFLFWMMKMLAYGVFPEHVILKNQVAYIPNTEAFAEHVYSVLSKKTNQWTSFQRNLNNYIKDWPFERRAVANTDLMSQTIEIPTIEELSLAWRNHGLSEEVFNEQKRELDMWVREHKSTRTVSRIKAPKEVEFKRKSHKFDGLCGVVEVGTKKRVKVIGTRLKIAKKAKGRGASRGGKGVVDEEVDELSSEEEVEPSQDHPSGQNDNRPLRPTSSSSSPSARPFWVTTNTPPKTKTSGDRSITRIDSSEKLHLRLRLDGTTWSVTPEKPKDANKRKFGCLSEGEGEDEDELTYSREIYTPSPSFTNPLITPQTGTNPTFAQPPSSSAGYWSNINNQLPTPVSLPNRKQARLEAGPSSCAGPSYPVEMGGSSRGSLSSGGVVENDVFGPVIEVGQGKE